MRHFAKSTSIIIACAVSLLPLQAAKAAAVQPDIYINNQTQTTLSLNSQAENYCSPTTAPSAGIPKKGSGSLTFTRKKEACSAMLGPEWANVIIQMKTDKNYIIKCANGYGCQCSGQTITVFPNSSGATYCELK